MEVSCIMKPNKTTLSQQFEPRCRRAVLHLYHRQTNVSCQTGCSCTGPRNDLESNLLPLKMVARQLLQTRLVYFTENNRNCLQTEGTTKTPLSHQWHWLPPSPMNWFPCQTSLSFDSATKTARLGKVQHLCKHGSCLQITVLPSFLGRKRAGSFQNSHGSQF